MKIFKEPLLHFLLIGIVMFAAYDVINGDADELNSHEIVVTRDELLTFIQYRAKAFEPSRFNRILNEMPADKLQDFVDDYVREEALYREAKALKLDRNDYVARRRLIQQLEFITRGFVSAGTELSEKDLEDYYQGHLEDYYQPAEITFTHVFFNRDRHGADPARALALETLKNLNDKKVPFHEGLTHGERFLYHANYVNKQADEIASHFGEAMQDQLFQLTPDDSVWHGPFSSPYGEHLVMVTRLRPGYEPELAEVRDRVSQDAQRERLESQLEEAIQSIVKGYDVKVVEGLQQASAPVQDTVSDAKG